MMPKIHTAMTAMTPLQASCIATLATARDESYKISEAMPPEVADAIRAMVDSAVIVYTNAQMVLSSVLDEKDAEIRRLKALVAELEETISKKDAEILRNKDVIAKLSNEVEDNYSRV